MQSTVLKNQPTVADEIIYPSEDGEPMAESDFQRVPLIYAIESLQAHFRPHEQIYVTGDLLIYYEEGNPAKSVAPDVCVFFGVPNHWRHSYKIWEEGKGPDVVIEILSHKTWKKDVQQKPKLYRQLGVEEYFLYDPLDKFIKPALQGTRLSPTGPAQDREIRLTKLADGTLTMPSRLLGLELHVATTGELQLYDPQAESYLYNYSQQLEVIEQETAARHQAESERLAETQARYQAEAAHQQAEAARLAETQTRYQIEAERDELARKLREAEAKLKQAGLD